MVRALRSQHKGSRFESRKIAYDDNNHDGHRDTANLTKTWIHLIAIILLFFKFTLSSLNLLYIFSEIVPRLSSRSELGLLLECHVVRINKKGLHEKLIDPFSFFIELQATCLFFIALGYYIYVYIGLYRTTTNTYHFSLKNGASLFDWTASSVCVCWRWLYITRRRKKDVYA